MASTLTRPTHAMCVTCMKVNGTFKCEGCLKIFCSKDSANHRHELIQKLEELEQTRDLIYQTFIQQSEDNSLLNQIYQREQKLIAEIHQTAEEKRNKVHQENIKFEQKLEDITNQLRQAREDDDFVEIDLHQWSQKLDELEKKLNYPKTILIEENSKSIVKKIHIQNENSSDIFQDICGDIQIKENGYLIVKDDWFGFSEALGKKDYTIGQHRIQFKIEQSRKNGWLLFGIISKSESMTINSYISPSSYGWTIYDQIYIAGQSQKGQNNDIILNDIITLIIDCDQKILQMKNERTGRIMNLYVDIKKCPFPWKLHFNLLTALTSIRILSTLN